MSADKKSVWRWLGVCLAVLRAAGIGAAAGLILRTLLEGAFT